MFSFARKNQKFSGAFLLALFLFVFFGGVLAPVFQARAAEGVVATVARWIGGGIDNMFFGAITTFFNGILYVILSIAGAIMSLELSVLGFLLDVMNWNNDVVKIGWNIIRDISNLFFILVILIIAFATVLQIESYGMKQLLPKLIFIALLINFSLVICGFLINFSNAFGDEFKGAMKGGAGLSASLASALQIPMTITEARNAEEQSRQGSAEDSLNRWIKMMLTFAFGILISFISIFVLGAGVFFIAVRQIALMMIVMLSPLALICMLLPFLNEYWSEWKKTFVKWLIFYPVYMFFVYVALKVLTSGLPMFSGAGLKADGAGFTAITSDQVMWKSIISALFLCGAIVAAQKMSITGAGAIGKFGTSALKTITGVGAAMRAGKAVKKRVEERVKEEKALRGAQLKSILAPTAVMRRKGELTAKAIEAKREKEFEKFVGLKRDEEGRVISAERKDLAKKFANKPGSRFQRSANLFLAGKFPARKSKPLTKEDIEKLEEKISKEK